MLKYPPIFVFLLLSSCSKQLKIVEKDKILVTIEDFPSTDTTIMVKDFFIKYRGEGAHIIGSVESPFADGHGNFKSSKSTTIDITEGKFAIY